MIAGGTVGLLFGPIGVLAGGILGAIFGNQAEYESIKSERERKRKQT